MKLLSTKEAAEVLKYKSDAYIRTLCAKKEIKAQKVGNAWVIPEKELGKIKRIRKQYRPRKTS